jgi:hypothetical protein
MKTTKEFIEKCKRESMTCSEIARLAKTSCSTIYSFCKRNDIALPVVKRGGQNVINMTGEKFGSLTVTKRAESKNKLAMWECQCKCGNTCVCRGADLRQGKIKTCGCRKGIKSRRNWQGHGEIPRSYWSSLANNADQRGKEFKIDIQQANDLFLEQNKQCALSGRIIGFGDRSASMDRIDNTKGYTIDNVQWLHKDVNKAKGQFTQDEFALLCEQIANHRRNKCH